MRFETSRAIILLHNAICISVFYRRFAGLLNYVKASVLTAVVDFNRGRWLTPNSLGSSYCKFYRFKCRTDWQGQNKSVFRMRLFLIFVYCLAPF